MSPIRFAVCLCLLFLCTRSAARPEEEETSDPLFQLSKEVSEIKKQQAHLLELFEHSPLTEKEERFHRKLIYEEVLAHGLPITLQQFKDVVDSQEQGNHENAGGKILRYLSTKVLPREIHRYYY